MGTPLTNLGLIGEFTICDKDIIAGLNTNFQLLDNLVQLSVNEIVAVLPGAPVEGDKYILSTDKSINLWDGSAWITYPAQEGYVGFNKDDGLIYFFDGTNWVVQFNAIAIFYDNTISGLTATNVKTAIDELKANSDLIEADVVTIQSDITNVQNDISDIQGDISIINASLTSATSAYTALLTDKTIVCSGATFNLTLPTAVGNNGKEYTIVHGGTSLSQTYALVTTGGQTVGGISSGGYRLYTNGETSKIVSNNTNWIILDHFAETPWINSGAVTIGATGTAPTKATTRTKDALFWKRSGNIAYFSLQYKQGATTGAAAGSGGYLFSVPSNMTIDTTITGTNTGTAISNIDQSYGPATVGGNTIMRPSVIMVYSTTQFTIWSLNFTSNSYQITGSANFQTTDSANMYYGAEFSLPISGWRP